MDNNQNSKIHISKIQSILDWTKKLIYLDTIAEKARNRIVYRGEVYLCDFGIGIGSEMQKNRPCLVIQANIGNINSSNVIVAPITHTNKPIPSMTHITTQYSANGKVILDGQVNLSNIQTVSKARLGNFVARLSKTDLEQVYYALHISLGLKDKTN